MATYFSATNSNSQTIIDDTYRYLYVKGSLNISGGANNPTYANVAARGDSSTGTVFSMELNKTDTWFYLDNSDDWLDYSTYKTNIFMRIQTINKDRLYGIRFKKVSDSPLCWVRINQTPIGSMINKSTNTTSLFIEVYPSVSTLTLSEAINNYFEIVEIANNNETMPSCNFGAEIRNASGEIIWNSNCNMVDVVASYNVSDSSNYIFSGAGTSHIVVPSRNYGYSNWRFDSSGFKFYASQTQDFWRLSSSGLINESLVLQPYHGYYGNWGSWVRTWDVRDFGTDYANAKSISGIICKAFF